MRVGVISDTHGLLRPEAVEALRGCERIIHAGDVGDPDILPELARIAPVDAVRGNVDLEPWARKLPETLAVETGLGGASVYVVHDLYDLDLDPAAAGFDVVVSGHSHRPSVEQKNGVMYLNPGSAGPRRFTLPVTVAILRVGDGPPSARIVEIVAGGGR
jgi:putative phosphoesterase